MTSNTTNKFSPEVWALAVRMVLDHASAHPSRWAAVTSIAAKIGCTPQTLHDLVKKAEVDSGQRAPAFRRSGVPADMAEAPPSSSPRTAHLENGQAPNPVATLFRLMTTGRDTTNLRRACARQKASWIVPAGRLSAASDL